MISLGDSSGSAPSTSFTTPSPMEISPATTPSTQKKSAKPKTLFKGQNIFYNKKDIQWLFTIKHAKDIPDFVKDAMTHLVKLMLEDSETGDVDFKTGGKVFQI